MTSSEQVLETQVRQLASDISKIMVEHGQVVREKDKIIRELQKSLLNTQMQLEGIKNSTQVKEACQEMLSKQQNQNDDAIQQLKEQHMQEWLQKDKEMWETREKLQDMQWVEFDSDESLHEYDRLYSIYGQYMGGGAKKLLDFWMSIGGAKRWRSYLRPSQLRLLLSREKTTELMYRVTDDRLPVRGGTLIPEEEVTSFFSNVLPRLPNLEYLALYECNVNPFDWETIGQVRLHYQPFPSLKGLDIRFTKCTDCDLTTFLVRVPSMVIYNGCYTVRDDAYFYNGLWIDDWCIDYTTLNRDSLELVCGRKLLIV